MPDLLLFEYTIRNDPIESPMKAAVYYTLTNNLSDNGPAFSAADRARLSVLFKRLQEDGHILQGIYITDRTALLCKSSCDMVRRDAALHCFDLLYLYLYDIPLAVSAKKLSDILDLPVNGRTSIFD